MIPLIFQALRCFDDVFSKMGFVPRKAGNGIIRRSVSIIAVIMPLYLYARLDLGPNCGDDDFEVDIDLYLTEWRIRFAHLDVAGHIRHAAVYNKETSNVGR
jgi:hypothetical protein